MLISDYVMFKFLALFRLLRLFTVSTLILRVIASNLPISNQKFCRPVSDDLLQKRLGDAFDARYMSMADPRRAHHSIPFGPQLSSLDSNDETGNADSTSIQRRHRRRHFKEPWSCDTIPEVIDLGDDHYPRYLNSKKCTTQRCFFGAYYCRPRLYSVNILRRSQNRCIEISMDDLDSMPYEILDREQEPILVEEWEFIKYSVVVFCECKVFPDRFPT